MSPTTDPRLSLVALVRTYARQRGTSYRIAYDAVIEELPEYSGMFRSFGSFERHMYRVCQSLSVDTIESDEISTLFDALFGNSRSTIAALERSERDQGNEERNRFVRETARLLEENPSHLDTLLDRYTALVRSDRRRWSSFLKHLDHMMTLRPPVDNNGQFNMRA